MSRWGKIIMMCTIYVCTMRAAAIDGARTSEDRVTKPKSINDVCFTWECLTTASWIRNNMNVSVDPCDDFYEFTCGRFGKHLTGPGEYAKDVYAAANDELETRLKYIIEDIDKANTPKPFKLVKILYDNCLNSDKPELSQAELFRYYKNLRGPFGWPVLAGEKWRSLAMSQKAILSGLLDVHLDPDTVNANNLIPWVKLRRQLLDPAILRMGLNNEIVQAYYAYMVDMAVMFGADRSRAENELEEALRTEIMLANDTLSEADRWILYSAYTRTTVGEFAHKYSKWNMREFISSHIPQDYKLTDDDIIMVPKDFASIEKVMSQKSKRILANLIQWFRVEFSAATIGEEFGDRSRKFDNLLERSTEPVEKWQQCVEAVRSYLGLSLSALYQRKYIDPKITSDISEMVTFIHQKIYEIVQEAEWIDTVSKREALQKVENIIGHVSFRNEYKDDKKLEEFYKDLELVEGDVRQSIRNISAFLSNIAVRKLRYVSSRDDWTRNGDLLSKHASYEYEYNTFKVPVGFVLLDYYGLYRAKFLNYAALGFVIAHEMSHSLDSNGIFLDRNANLREWRSRIVKQKFDERVKRMIDQYGSYNVDELQAYRNLDENIADNLAVNAAYRAYLQWASRNKAEKLLPSLNYTPKQMFWIGVGNTWCRDYQNLELMNALLSDDHSPVKFRINGALANRPEFAEDFGCKRGSRMNPVTKCSVW